MLVQPDFFNQHDLNPYTSDSIQTDFGSGGERADGMNLCGPPLVEIIFPHVLPCCAHLFST